MARLVNSRFSAEALASVLARAKLNLQPEGGQSNG
jgi:hypothetical protein